MCNATAAIATGAGAGIEVGISRIGERIKKVKVKEIYINECAYRHFIPFKYCPNIKSDAAP